MGTLFRNGTADITNDVLSQLRKKHPPRRNHIAHSGPYPGWSQLAENITIYNKPVSYTPLTLPPILLV